MKPRFLVALAVVLAALGAVFVITRPEADAPPPPAPKAWSFEFLDLTRVSIALPPLGLAESWVKGPDKQWYFDEPSGPGSQVARDRWGGGVPAILSGPRAARAIATDVDDEGLKTYGLAEPAMVIVLETISGERVEVEVGDPTPTGEAYYFKTADGRDIYTIDYTWYYVLERLVTEPPYPGPESAAE